MLIYTWQSDKYYLLPALFPKAHIYQARMRDSAARVLDLVPAGCRSFFFHLNCTYTGMLLKDRERLVAALNERDIQVFNGNAFDISKAMLHKKRREAGLPNMQAELDGDPDELLIVKTNLNCAGFAEQYLSVTERKMLGIAPINRLFRMSKDYPIIPRKDVPLSWFSDQSLMIEKYIDNERKRFYRIQFLLDHYVVTEARSQHVIQKLTNATDFRDYYPIFVEDDPSPAFSGQVPENLLSECRTLQRAMNLDFGAMDAVIDNRGISYVVDVNSTPYFGDMEFHPTLDNLRKGFTPDEEG